MKTDNNEAPQVFYRYEAVQYAVLDAYGEFTSPMYPDPKIELREYKLFKETPKGYWIGYGTPKGLKGEARWIPKVSKKRFAYPTREEAIKGFIARTQRRLNIISYQVDYCSTALHRGKELLKKLKQVESAA